MTMTQAVAAMRRGKAVRREAWDCRPDPFGRGPHLVMRGDAILYCPHGRNWAAMGADIVATDWGLHECRFCEERDAC